MNSEETQNQAGQTAYLERAKTLGINPTNQVQVSATSGKVATPNTAVVMGQPLDAATLGQNKSLKVPEAIPQTTVASGIGGMASSIAETTGKALSDSVKADKEAKADEVKSSKNALQSVFDQYLSTTGSRQAEEEKAQIAQKAQATSDARAEAQTASNNIIASQRAQENEIAQLEKNLGGMSASALQGETQRINRQYAREQADLSLISLVANSKLNNANFDLATAQSIVDKKIENQLEPLKMQMDFAREFYQENRDAFSKAEDREFQNNALMAERAYNTEKANLERISALQLEAAKNGAPSSVIRAIGNAKTFDEAVGATGGYVMSVSDRLALSAPSGGYTSKQMTALTKLNEDVSKNATFAKTTAMRGYVDNVTASLSQGTGVGDLAAINQFQKVIDEGAVTRDQDVKLIQSSQSLLNSLKTKAKKLERGEQLSPELRQQMRTAVESLYEAQTKALSKDPYIQAKTREAEIYGLTTTDTILGEFSGFSRAQENSSASDGEVKEYNGITYKVVNGEWVPQIK